MVLQTNLLTKLSDKGLKVGIIGPEINSSNLVDTGIDKNITLIKFNPKIGFLIGQLQVLREYVLEDLRTNTALWDKHLERKRKSAGKPKEVLKNFFYTVVYHLVKVLKFLRPLYIFVERKLLISKEARNILIQYRPENIVSTYPVNWAEAILVENANKLGIKTTIHLLSWDNITCKGRFPTLANNYLAWGPIMKNEFIEHYNITPSKIRVTGVPHFDLHYQTINNGKEENLYRDLGLKAGQPYILFAMSAPRFAPKEIDIVEWLADQVNRGEFEKELNLIVRPHPQNVIGNMANSSWLDRLRNIRSNKVSVDFPKLSSGKMPWGMQQNDMPRMSQLLHNALVCLNSGSTMSIDSLLVDTPTIITSFDGNTKLPYWVSARRLIDFPHLKKFVKMGEISAVENYIDLKRSIHHVLKTNGELSDNMRYVVAQECGNLFGNSTNSVVKALIELN